MKIAMVSIGAASFARAVAGLAGALSTAGHEVVVYAAAADAVSAPPAGSETLAAQLVARWTTAPPDIVHAHSWAAGKIAFAAARALAIPTVVTFHGLAPAKGRRAGNGVAAERPQQERALVGAAARIIATSSPEVFALLELGARPQAIKLIAGGVDLDTFAPAPGPAAPTNLSRRVLRVATLSSLLPDAGVSDVIEALADVENVELTIGAGPYDRGEAPAAGDARALENLAAARGVGGRILFRGRIDHAEVASFLHAADALICAPRRDALGSVALEAMACGVPVIASAVGAHVDAVSDGITGLLVAPQAPRQIASALESLTNDSALRERFSRLGVERTRSRFGWKRIADETFDVYRSVVARRAVADGVAV